MNPPFPPPQCFRCSSKQPYTLSHPEAWVASFMTHDWSPSNVTDSGGQRSQSNKRNALTRLEWALLFAPFHGLNWGVQRELLPFFQCVSAFWLHLCAAISELMRTTRPNVVYLEHWMPSECGEMSKQTARPTPHWWQQQYAEGRWCRAAGFPGDDGSSLQVAPSVRLYSQRWCDRTNDRWRLDRDSACRGEAAKTPGCLWGCGWWGWAQGRGGELWTNKTGQLRQKHVLYHEVTVRLWLTHQIMH